MGTRQGSPILISPQASTHSHHCSKPTDGPTAVSTCVWMTATFSHGTPPTACYAPVLSHATLTAWPGSNLITSFSLERAGLAIECDKDDAIFYSPTRARPDTHGHRPSTITVPAGVATQLTVNCSDNVRYFWDARYRRGPTYWKDFS
jgi:hypothetical protein